MLLAQLYNESVNRLLRQETTPEPFVVQFRAALTQSDGTETEQAIHEFQKLCEDYLHLETITASPLLQKLPPIYDIAGLDPVKRAEDGASAERNRLGLGDGTIANLRKILENEVGIRIFGMPLPSKIAGLFAHTEQLGACIATNTNHPRDRQLMTLIHEYGHSLPCRNKADIFILKAYGRMPASERFAEAFARFFLMPTNGLQRRFHDIKKAKKDNITPADLLALADLLSVSFQALVLRLEELRLLPTGTWDGLNQRGFQVRKAQDKLGMASKAGSGELELPYRYRALAAEAWDNGDITEGQLAQLLRADRVRAREIVEEFIDRDVIDEEGERRPITFDLSLPLTETVEA